MARIRTIKPEFWTDEKIINLPLIARLLFIGLWNFADDYGMLEDKPEQLRLLVLPNEKGIDIFELVDLLMAAELIDRYVDYENDKTFLSIKNWFVHQKVDHPTKSRIATPDAKKVCIPTSVRRKVAEKYGCKMGGRKECECYFCGTAGSIYWPTKSDGSPSYWVCFSLELSHLEAESNGGETTENNIVLACRNCNRSMGVKNAFDWLFNGKYYTNQKRAVIETFRIVSREFEKTLEDSSLKGKERKGGDRKGKGITAKAVGAVAPPTLLDENLKKKFEEAKKTKKGLVDFINADKPKFIEPYFLLWNIFASKYSVPAIKQITPSRKRKFNVRIGEEGFNLVKILETAAKSEFLRTSKWFGFDWIIANDKNWLKVLEGNYDQGFSKPTNGQKVASVEQNAAQSGIEEFVKTMNYLMERYADGELDESLVLPEYYDKLVLQNVLPRGTLDKFKADTIDGQKIKAILDYFEEQKQKKLQSV